MADLDRKLAALDSEEERLRQHKVELRKKAEALQKECDKDNQRLKQIGEQRHRLKLMTLLDRPEGVQMGFRVPAGAKGSELNDMRGVLREVRRAWATVEFDGVTWEVPLDDLQAAGELQGERIVLFR